MAKTVKIKGTFEIFNDSGVVEAKKVISNDLVISEATQHFPQKVTAGATVQIGFGGVVQAKRIFLRASHAVQVQLNQSSDIGASYGPGDVIIMSDTGITELHITAGVNETEIEVIVAGE